MDLTFSDEQQAISALAADVFGGEVTVERIKAVEQAGGFDRELWRTLAATGLLGVALPEAAGGTGGGAIELACLLEQHGRSVAPLPLAQTLVAAMVLAGGSSVHKDQAARVAAGDAVLTVAADLAGRPPAVVATEASSGWRLDGTVVAVPFGSVAEAVLVDAGDRVLLVALDQPGVTGEATSTTDRLDHANLTFTGATAEPVGDAGTPDRLRALLRIGLAAVALGVAEEALQRAAAYTSQRHQFGKPLSSFQSTAHRAADCYIDVEAMRATLWQAASQLDEGDDAAADAALVAAWWAADGGARVVQAVQHLHGGLGADLDYPVHRFFLWGTQLDIELGGAAALLAQIGDGIARRAHAQEVRS